MYYSVSHHTEVNQNSPTVPMVYLPDVHSLNANGTRNAALHVHYQVFIGYYCNYSVKCVLKLMWDVLLVFIYYHHCRDSTKNLINKIEKNHLATLKIPERLIESVLYVHLHSKLGEKLP